MDLIRLLAIGVILATIWMPDSAMGQVRAKKKILLGYLTGSRKKPNNYFYEKPGQSISGGITLAVKEVRVY